jgi:HEAT repeat protein
MDDRTGTTPDTDIVTLLEHGRKDDALTALEQLSTADAADQQACFRSLKSAADDQPQLFDGVLSPITRFLADSERPTRLTAAKLFVAVSEGAPDSVVPVVPTLAERLADESEFYYVRARCAEALGYVAVDHPDAVASPAVVADLRIGLEFDEPEVREKLAKALAHVALGDPARLRYQVDSLADHLQADSELVRYHLSTAIVVTGCACPERLTDAREALVSRLEDENRYVRGRAAEALGLLAGADAGEPFPRAQLEELTADDEFVAERAQFALTQYHGTEPDDGPTGIAGRDAIRTQTTDIVEEIRTPEDDGGCPHCGLSLPESGPPLCPSCGTPL